MRRIVRLVIALSVLAALRRARRGGSRAHVGRLPRRPELPLGRRTARSAVQGASQTNATIMRLLVQWNLAAKTRPSNPANPFDPAYNLDDIDEAVRAAQENDQEVDPDALRNAALGERRQEPQRHAAPRRRLHQLRARNRLAVLRPVRRAIRSCASSRSGTSRTSAQFLAPQFNAQGRSVAPANYAKLAAAAYTGIKAGNRAGAGRDRRDVGARKRQADGPASQPHAGQVRRARREGEPAPEVRRVVAPPVPVQPELASDAARQVAERVARSLPRFDAEPEEVVQAEVRPDLGHRVRPPDEARGRARASRTRSRRLTSSSRCRWCRGTRSCPCSSGSSTRTTQGQARSGSRGSTRAAATPKGQSPSRFTATARPLDARNGVVVVPRGTLTPLVNVHTRRYCANEQPRHADRHDVARLPRRHGSSRRPADRSAAQRLHDRRAASDSRAASHAARRTR